LSSLAVVLVNISAFLGCDSSRVASSCCIPGAKTELAVRALASYCCAECHSVSQFWIRVFVQFLLRSGAKRKNGSPMLLVGWKSHETRSTLTQSKRYRHSFLDSSRTHVLSGYTHSKTDGGPRADASEQRLIWAVRVLQPQIEEPTMNWRRGESAKRIKPILA
jgi:hypothetical protein